MVCVCLSDTEKQKIHLRCGEVSKGRAAGSVTSSPTASSPPDTAYQCSGTHGWMGGWMDLTPKSLRTDNHGSSATLVSCQSPTTTPPFSC